MDIGKDLQDAYEHGRQDALTELMEYTYGMLTAEKFGLQHKIKSMMADRIFKEEPKTEPLTCDGNCWMKKQNGEWLCEHCQREPKTEPQTIPIKKTMTGSKGERIEYTEAEMVVRNEPKTEPLDKDTNVRSKEPQTDPCDGCVCDDGKHLMYCMNCKGIASKTEPPKVEDEPQTDEEYINSLPWTEAGNGEQTDIEIARAIVHKAIDDTPIAEDEYPDLRQKMHDAVDNYEPQTDCAWGKGE